MKWAKIWYIVGYNIIEVEWKRTPRTNGGYETKAKSLPETRFTQIPSLPYQNVEVQTNLPVLVTKEKPTLSRNRNRPANNSSTSTIQDHLQINRAFITDNSAKRRRHHTSEIVTMNDSRAATW